LAFRFSASYTCCAFAEKRINSETGEKMAPMRRDDETKSLMKFLWAGGLALAAFTVWLSIGQDRAQEVTSNRRSARSSEPPCPHCEGQKKMACPRCGGFGRAFGANGEANACDVCQGSGAIDCMVCGGRGTLTAPVPAALRWGGLARP
jgi:hypothetical protein